MDQDHEMEISDTEVWQSNADRVSHMLKKTIKKNIP